MKYLLLITALLTGINAYARKSCGIQCISVSIIRPAYDSVKIDTLGWTDYKVTIQYKNTCSDTCAMEQPYSGREIHKFPLYFDVFEIINGDTVVPDLNYADIDPIIFDDIILPPGGVHSAIVNIMGSCNIYRRGTFIIRPYYREFLQYRYKSYNAIAIKPFTLTVY